MRQLIRATIGVLILSSFAIAEEHDFYRHLRYPTKLVPGVSLDNVQQEGGENAKDYQRRTVHWWARYRRYSRGRAAANLDSQ